MADSSRKLAVREKLGYACGDIARFPQTCVRADRLSALRQWDLEEEDAIANEMRGGLEVIASGETLSGAARFASGVGRHGAFGGDSGKAALDATLSGHTT